VNFLRLWEARASNEFDFELFNKGNYAEAVHQKAAAETISKVLYPNDKTSAGRELRFIQQIFFASCSLQDLIRRFKRDSGSDWAVFPDKVAIQLNDTHPAIAVAELMRLFVDIEGLGVGRGVGHRHPRLRLHQPHAAPGSARKMERAAFRESPSAPPPNHL